jgi:hypothetical protein
MKKLSVSVLVLMVLLAIPASRLYAQSEGTWFKVPFPFVVAAKEMPAGYCLALIQPRQLLHAIRADRTLQPQPPTPHRLPLRRPDTRRNAETD